MKLKKLIIVLFFITIFFLSNINYVYADENQLDFPSVNAKSYIILDNKTNKILYSKNENEKMYPASTTKILTAIIVLENCNLEDKVTATYDAIMGIPEGYSSANIQIGEEFSVEQLLELLLIPSANDAANVLAEHVGGSVNSFVSMMNTKINELNLNNTHFTNAYGLHDENHYTTAYDLAKIMQYCLKNDTFRKIAGQASCAIPATNKSGTRSYSSTDDLINPNSKNYYKNLTAGKTGTTTQAKQCLVSSAYLDNLELICAVLGSESRASDTRKIYDYAYSNYCIKNIVNEKDVLTNIEVKWATQDTKNLDLLANTDVSALVKTSYSENEIEPEINLNEKISAPIEEGTVLGKVTYNIDGIEYSTNLIASHNVEKTKIFNYILYFIIGVAVLIIAKRVGDKWQVLFG